MFPSSGLCHMLRLLRRWPPWDRVVTCYKYSYSTPWSYGTAGRWQSTGGLYIVH